MKDKELAKESNQDENYNKINDYAKIVVDTRNIMSTQAKSTAEIWKA